MRRCRKNLETVAANHPEVLYTHPEITRKIDARLDCDHISVYEIAFGVSRKRGHFVYVDTDTMAQPMSETFSKTRIGYGTSSEKMDVLASYARLHEVFCAGIHIGYDSIDIVLPVFGLPIQTVRVISER